ncbi:MAG: hypothetical protein ACTSU4_03555 [Promethearchaeota archaeon]
MERKILKKIRKEKSSKMKLVRNFKISEVFKFLTALGLLSCIISICSDWYALKVLEGNVLIVEWRFSLLNGWYSKNNKDNIIAYPQNLDNPLILPFSVLILTLFSLFQLIFRDIENSENLEPLKIHAYSNIVLLFLMGYYIVIFPLKHLILNNFYFPFAIISTEIGGTTFYYHYSVGLGYYLMVFSFILVFPYFLHYYFIQITFEQEKNENASKIENLIYLHGDEIDFDKLIAEEEGKLWLFQENKEGK